MYEPPYTGEFRAQDLEIAATFQLTHSDEIIYRFSDVSMKGELAVSAYPAVIDGALEAACGLWLLSPETGQIQEISKGVLSYPWGALFSPDGERIIYAAGEECPSATAQSIDGGIWLLELRTMERSALYESERAPVLRGWAYLDIFLAMRHVPDVGWTYRIIHLGESSERVVPDLALEYQGFYLFTDRPSPQGDLLLRVDQDLTSSFNSELSLASLITGEPIVDPWQGWPHPHAGDSPWSPDNRSLLYLVAGSIQEGMPIDLMTLDVRTGEHRAILSGLSPEDAFIPQAWSPDSQVVLLLPEDRTTLHAVNVDGSGFGEVAGSTLSAPKSNYRGVRWSLDGGYLFFHRDPPLPRGEIVTTMETEIWAAVVRLPGESDADLQERVRQLQAGPWPVYLQPSAP